MEDFVEVYSRRLKWLVGLSIGGLLAATATAFMFYFRELHLDRDWLTTGKPHFTAILLRGGRADVALQKETSTDLNTAISFVATELGGGRRSWEGRGRSGAGMLLVRVVHDPIGDTFSVELKEGSHSTVQLIISEFQGRWVRPSQAVTGLSACHVD